MLKIIYNLHAHNGIGFDAWIILNILPCDKRIVDFFKNGKGIFELTIFNGHVQNIEKQFPQYVHFRCGMTLLTCSLQKLGRTFKLQKEISKKEKNHDEVYEDKWRDKKFEWVDCFENDVICTAFSYAR